MAKNLLHPEWNKPITSTNEQITKNLTPVTHNGIPRETFWKQSSLTYGGHKN